MNRLKDYRKLRGITAKEFAQAVGTSRSNISMIEIGAREPNLELAKRIADYFGTSIEAIFFADGCHESGRFNNTNPSHRGGQSVRRSS